jgi:hypothetical protein
MRLLLCFRRWLQLELPPPPTITSEVVSVLLFLRQRRRTSARRQQQQQHQHGCAVCRPAVGTPDPHHGLMRHILISFVARLVSIGATNSFDEAQTAGRPVIKTVAVSFLHSWSNGIQNISSRSIKSETQPNPKRSTTKLLFLSYNQI